MRPQPHLLPTTLTLLLVVLTLLLLTPSTAAAAKKKHKRPSKIWTSWPALDERGESASHEPTSGGLEPTASVVTTRGAEYAKYADGVGERGGEGHNGELEVGMEEEVEPHPHPTGVEVLEGGDGGGLVGHGPLVLPTSASVKYGIEGHIEGTEAGGEKEKRGREVEGVLREAGVV